MESENRVIAPAPSAGAEAAVAPASSQGAQDAPELLSAVASAAPPGAAAPTAASLQKVKIKKPKTAYFWYLEDHRDSVKTENPGIGLGEIAKRVAAKWKALTTEGQQPYHDKAKEDKERYAKARKEALANGTLLEEATPSWTPEGTDSAFPIGRVRKIIKRDREVKQIQREAVNLVAKATDLFVAFLSEQTLGFTQKRRKRTVTQLDVLQAVHTGAESLEFLAEDFQTPDQLNEELSRAKKRRAAAKKQELAGAKALAAAEGGEGGAAEESGLISNFFPVKKEGGGVVPAAEAVEAAVASPAGNDAAMDDVRAPAPAASDGSNPFATFAAH